jgi:hypothetical protein
MIAYDDIQGPANLKYKRTTEMVWLFLPQVAPVVFTFTQAVLTVKLRFPAKVEGIGIIIACSTTRVADSASLEKLALPSFHISCYPNNCRGTGLLHKATAFIPG